MDEDPETFQHPQSGDAGKPQDYSQQAPGLFICMCVYMYISRIRRNLSIHIARFSASESPRAYTNIPQNPHFSLVAG